jgi:hypothetical protein
MTMTIEDTFQVGCYRCIARYDGPVPVTGKAGVLDVTFEWAPSPPDPGELTAAELKTYRSERDAFLARVMSVGVH